MLESIRFLFCLSVCLSVSNPLVFLRLLHFLLLSHDLPFFRYIFLPILLLFHLLPILSSPPTRSSPYISSLAKSPSSSAIARTPSPLSAHSVAMNTLNTNFPSHSSSSSVRWMRPLPLFVGRYFISF